MIDPTRSPHPGLEGLLREEVWLRRLAIGLTTDTAAADDLTQEVLATALREEPPADRPRLRSWLRTVARRLAARRGERDRNRQRAERLAARPESVERRTEDRLALHARLNEAIQALAPEHRAVLVLRYLEERPPREIARELEISEAAARKRVSRALALLRAELDRRGGGRESWLGAVSALALGDGWTPPVPPSAAPPAIEAAGASVTLGFISMKKLLAGAAVLALLLVAGTARLARPDRSNPASAEPGPAQASEPGLVAAEAKASADERRAPAAPADPAPGQPAARLLVVDAADQPVANARAAWIDAQRSVRGLPLDGAASAPLPAGSEGRLLLASAPGFSARGVSCEDLDADVRIVLEPTRTLRGRVTVDGDVPAEAVQLTHVPRDEHLEIARDGETRRKQVAQLRELSILRGTSSTSTLPDGSFLFEEVHPEASGLVIVPDSYRTRSGSPTSVLFYRSPQEELVLDLTRRPYLHGHCAWSADGSPVEGTLLAVFEKEGQGFGTSVSMDLWEGGYFEVGFPEGDDEGTLAHAAVTLQFEPSAGVARDDVRRFELKGRELPWDVGTIQLERPTELTIQVVDGADVPIAGATVFADGVRARHTESDGRVRLEAEGLDAFEVLAYGYQPRSVPIHAAPAEDDGTLVVRLEPGVGLRISAPDLKLDDSLSAQPRLVLEHGPDLFEHARANDEQALKWGRDALFARHRSLTPYTYYRKDAPWATRFPWTGAPLELAGLRAGAQLDVVLVDAFGNELIREHVRLPAAPGLHAVELAFDPVDSCSLTVQLTDEYGAPIERARLMVRTPGIGGKGQEVTGGSITLRPLARGPYSIEVSAQGYLSTERTGTLDVREATLAVQLQGARDLNLKLRTEVGEPAEPDWVVVRSQDGWSSNRLHDFPADGVSIRKAPLGELEAFVRLGSRTLRRALTVVEGEAVLTLPAVGVLRAGVDDPAAPTSEWGQLVLRVEELDAPGAGTPVGPSTDLPEWILGGYPEGSLVRSESFTGQATGRLEIRTSLLPGRYAVELVLVDGDGEDATRTTLLTDEVTVAAGDDVRLVAQKH